MINLVNSNNFNKDSFFETDILIIGSGINCLSFVDFFLSLNSCDIKKKITIIEKGELNKSILTSQRTNLNVSKNYEKINNEGSFKFDVKGMNQTVSGNSSFWGGRFTRLDKEDFLSRNWIEGDKKWPIDFDHYNEALDHIYSYYKLGENLFSNFYNKIFQSHLIKSQNLENKIFYIKFINFFKLLHQKNNHKHTVDIYYNADVEKLNFLNQRILSVDIKNSNSIVFNIKATKIILSSGVLGNIKTLLRLKKNSNLVDSKNIVGKFVMNHPGGKILEIENHNKVFSSMYFGSNFMFSSYRYGLKSSIDFQKKNRITNSLLLFQPYYLVNKTNPLDLNNWFKRKFLGTFDNKIELKNENLNININFDKYLYHNLDLLIRELLKYFSYEKRNIPKIIDSIYSKTKFEDTYHYIGGTIMGEHISDSVVDTNLKHHEIDNLYVLGASVFPKSGHANPVATQLFLSYRLAIHLHNL